MYKNWWEKSNEADSTWEKIKIAKGFDSDYYRLDRSET